MTADLPALLQRAAQALPRRFGVSFKGLGVAPYRLDSIERACREECEARNLAWTVGRWMVMGPPYAATVTGEFDHYEQYGASPAEALLLALLEAVEAGE